MGFMKRFREDIMEAVSDEYWICIKAKSECRRHDQLLKVLTKEAEKFGFDVFVNDEAKANRLGIRHAEIQLQESEKIAGLGSIFEMRGDD